MGGTYSDVGRMLPTPAADHHTYCFKDPSVTEGLCSSARFCSSEEVQLNILKGESFAVVQI